MLTILESKLPAILKASSSEQASSANANASGMANERQRRRS